MNRSVEDLGLEGGDVDDVAVTPREKSESPRSPGNSEAVLVVSSWVTNGASSESEELGFVVPPNAAEDVVSIDLARLDDDPAVLGSCKHVGSASSGVEPQLAN
jgi:hypothetical protein